MKHVFISCGYALAGLGAVGWIAIILTGIMFAGPTDSVLTDFFAETIIIAERLETFDVDFTYVADDLFSLVAQMNLSLLIITSLIALGWSAGSHYLNIDSPGKAKIYFIHWIILTAIFIAIVFGIVIFFTQSSTFESAQFIGTGGTVIITIVSLIYYFLMYYVGVILGTARFARSSVLFANKLPGNL